MSMGYGTEHNSFINCVQVSCSMLWFITVTQITELISFMTEKFGNSCVITVKYFVNTFYRICALLLNYCKYL